jgi:hypothetical protein
MTASLTFESTPFPAADDWRSCMRQLPHGPELIQAWCAGMDAPLIVRGFDLWKRLPGVWWRPAGPFTEWSGVPGRWSSELLHAARELRVWIERRRGGG